jgi:hypothetical protein
MFTESILKKKQKQGLIRGYRVTLSSKKGQRKKLLKKVGKQKYWMEIVLQEWCEKKGYELVPEFQFLTNRKFRFDYSVPVIKLAIEYEGIYSQKSRHTTKEGYSKDAEKYTAAAVNGWKVLRYTASTYKNLTKDLEEIK